MSCKKIIVNWSQAAELAKAHCSGAEIASYFGISTKTLYRHSLEDNGLHFQEFMTQHRNTGKAELRLEQHRKALKGNTMMLIWLGKQNLDQFDKSAINMTTTYEHKDLRSLNMNELKILSKNPQLTIAEVKSIAKLDKPDPIENVPQS